LLVLGSHGRQGLAKLTLGSVAEWAIHRLNYPVLVAGQLETNFAPGQVHSPATHLTEHASRPARYASSVAQNYNARLMIINVLPPASWADEQTGAELSTTKKLHHLMPKDCAGWCTLNSRLKPAAIAPAIL
jgi:hypothetical protein